MTDVLTREQRSYCMSRIRSSNTKPEFAIKELLDRLGVYYEYQAKVLGYKVDFFLPSKRLVVEYRSCFWHLHGCQLSHVPRSKTEYWIPKLERNRRRDIRKDEELGRAGYRVFIIRDCDKERQLKNLEVLLSTQASHLSFETPLDSEAL